MRLVINLTLTAAILGTVVVAYAAADEPKGDPIFNAQSGLAKLKTLSGRWVSKPDGTEDSGDYSVVTFKVAANSSIVIATFYEGTPTEMISVFHLDGDDELVHTHYCALGNQPTMRFTPSTNPGELKFLFAGGTNMDPEVDVHVHNTTLRFLDGGEIENEVETYAEGESDGTLKFRLMRSDQ